MRTSFRIRALLCAAALLVVPAVAQAQYTIYTTLSSFLAAVGANATDTFSGVPTNLPTAAPYQRNIGAFSYQAFVPFGFRGVGTAANPALSQARPGTTWFIDGFTSNTRAFGGNFWNTDEAGNFANGGIIFGVVDAAGNRFDPSMFIPTSPTSFWGIVLTGALSQIYMQPVTFGNSQTFATMDNFILAAAPTNVVPEPATFALLGAGLLCLGVTARRRRLR